MLCSTATVLFAKIGDKIAYFKCRIFQQYLFRENFRWEVSAKFSLLFNKIFYVSGLFNLCNCIWNLSMESLANFLGRGIKCNHNIKQTHNISVSCGTIYNTESEMKSSGDLINNKNTMTYPWRNLGEEKARTGFRPSWGKTCGNVRFCLSSRCV
jgi:hypothetical protein